MIAFSRNRIAKKIVQRFKFRSTIEPPPSGPVPLPTPNAPERPASLPECISTRKITITEMSTCRTENIVSTALAYRAGADPDSGSATVAQPGDYGQATVAVALAVERSAKVNAAANGKPPAGQLRPSTIAPAVCARGLRPARPTVSDNERNEASGWCTGVEIGGTETASLARPPLLVSWGVPPVPVGTLTP